MPDGEIVGYVGVDAGLVWVGDPCYVMGEDASYRVESWDEFCDALGEDYPTVAQPLGEGVGMAISSGLGDGLYPVYVEYSDEGSWGKRVSRITIDFGLSDESEDDWNDEDEDDDEEQW